MFAGRQAVCWVASLYNGPCCGALESVLQDWHDLSALCSRSHRQCKPLTFHGTDKARIVGTGIEWCGIAGDFDSAMRRFDSFRPAKSRPASPFWVRLRPRKAQGRLGVGSDGLEGQSDALAAADAERDDATPQAVAAHGVQQARREHGTRCADRMAMRDGATLDVDDVLRQAELLGRQRAARPRRPR